MAAFKTCQKPRGLTRSATCKNERNTNGERRALSSEMMAGPTLAWGKRALARAHAQPDEPDELTWGWLARRRQCAQG
eukprot:2635470-Alexandrium_andersonii.AAC.1